MLTCVLTLCMLQTLSAIPDKLNFVFVDTETGEKLTVEWISPDITKNIQGETCWLYDGEHTFDCDISQGSEVQ